MAARARSRPRPRFSLSSQLSPGEIRTRVNAHIRASSRLRGLALEDRIELAIDGPEHNFWSPQLVVQMRPTEAGGTLLEARFGPDPYVWALYLLLNGALLVITFWALVFGLVQWWLKQPQIALWIAPGAAVLACLVYGASFVGQGLGSDQMYFLRATLSELCETSTFGPELPAT
jgi:hypothetical protein